MAYFLITIIILCFLSFVSYRRVINTNSIIVLWWGGWYLISTMSLTGIDRSGNNTGNLILLLLSGFTLGNLFYFPRYNKFKLNLTNNYKANSRLYLSYIKLIKYTYIPILLIFAFYAVKAIYIMKSQGLIFYRLATFSSERSGGVSVLYGNLYIDLFIQYFIISYLIAFILLGSVLSIYYRKLGMLLLSLVLVLMYTIMQLGRFPFYFFSFFLLTSYFLISINKSSFVLNAKKIIYPIMLAFIFIFSLQAIRGEEYSFDSIASIAKQAVIDNHTLGFVLFDKELNDTHSALNQHYSFGLRAVGGVSALIEQVYRKLINSDFNTLAFYEGTAREYDVTIGYDEYGPKTANAFYTCLYTLYMDGRQMTIFMIPFILGLLMKINYVKWHSRGNIKNLIYVIVILFSLFFSIFQSQFESTANWIAILYLFIFLNMKNISFCKLTPKTS